MKVFRRFFILTLAIASLCFWATWMSSPSMAEMDETPAGMIQMPSQFSVTETGDRFEAALQQRQLTLFSRIDHAQNAASVDKELRETQLLIFGNPNAGTPLMQCNQTVAIDLPQKTLIWQDESGQVWLAYNDPAYLMERHSLTGCENVIEQVSGALNALATEATQ